MNALWASLLLLFAACSDGGPDSVGNNDTIFTGVSGVILLGVAIWFLVRYLRKKKGTS